MPDTGHSGPQPAAPAVPADAHALAQVEKWMAVIREVSDRPRNVAPVANNAPAAGEDR
jgi:hypothetical protein